MFAILVLLAADQPAATPPRPPALARVLDCRSIADQQQRLACFDASVAALAEAEATRQVVVVDREELRQARRRQFGFEGVQLPFFSGDDSADAVPDTITSTVAAVRDLGYGRWSVELKEGGTWRMTEAARHDPYVGQSAQVKRAALGSFMISVNNRRAVRAVRVR